MIRAQCALIGSSSSPVTWRSSGLMPPVGSSSSSSLGFSASAMAISSHCCSPWLSSPARSSARSIRRKRSSRPLTSPSSAPARRRQQQPGQALARLRRQQHVVVDRQFAQHRGDLEFQAEAGAGALVGRGARDVVAVEHDGAAVGEMSAGNRLQAACSCPIRWDRSGRGTCRPATSMSTPSSARSVRNVLLTPRISQKRHDVLTRRAGAGRRSRCVRGRRPAGPAGPWAGTSRRSAAPGRG